MTIDAPDATVGRPAPVRIEPLPSWPRFEPDEVDAVRDVLESGKVSYWTGRHGRSFEREFAAWVGAPFAVAVSNGTVALELLLSALGVGPGDEVVVPAATFIATASAVARCGAIPVVVDVTADRQCMDPAALEAAVTEKTKAVIVVHLAGQPADMASIMTVARRHGVRVVEDCAQAHGARIDGRMVGSFGDGAAWSFCQDKIMTTAGEGGAITTADRAVWRRCWELKDHGKSYAAVQEPNPSGSFRWLHDSFGTNARMTEVQAAVGRLQLLKIDRWVERRRSHASALASLLAVTPGITLPAAVPGVEPSWYRFYIHVELDLLKPDWSRARIAGDIRAAGIPCSEGSCFEIYREAAFGKVSGAPQRLPMAERLGSTSLALLVHPTLTGDDISRTASAVDAVMHRATT